MKSETNNHSYNWLFNISVSYIIALFSWFFLYIVFGDSNGFLGLANALALYLFVPLPIITLIALRLKFKKLMIPLLSGVIIFAFLWGPLFFSSGAPFSEASVSLRVMTFNVLGRAGSHEPILKTIREEAADVIFLQELTPEIASVISLRLSDEYPYQILQAASRSRGLGVISRYPLQKLDALIPGNWMGAPQILEMDLEGAAITLVNFHTIPTGSLWPRRVVGTFADRERDLAALANFAVTQRQIGPLIVAGDANTTRLNEAYKSLAAELEDAWLQGGFGFGHSFPGPYEEGNSYAQISFFRIPYWLVSIDYIFYSNEFAAMDTWMGVFYGGTDHRAVVSDILLKPQTE